MALTTEETRWLRKAIADGRAGCATSGQLIEGRDIARREGLSGIGDELAGRINEKTVMSVPWGTVFVGLLIGVVSNLIARQIK